MKKIGIEPFSIRNKSTGIGLDEWLSLSNREKWVIFEKMGDIKWSCGFCKKPDGAKPRRASPFEGCSICCGHCEEELTHRTGGGQSDPFDWIPTSLIKP